MSGPPPHRVDEDPTFRPPGPVPESDDTMLILLSRPVRRLLLPLLATAALAIPGLVRGAELLDRIVAIVDDEVVLATELNRFVQRIADELRSRNTPLPPVDTLRRQALDRLILDHIQLQRAKEIGIRVDDEELNRAIANIARQNQMDLETFRAALASQGVDFRLFREDIRNEIIISRLQKIRVLDRIRVSEQEIREALQNQGADALEGRRFHLAHILIALPDAPSPEQIRDRRARAEKVLAALEEGGDFARLAVEYSDGRQALQGGDLGWIDGTRVPDIFVDALKELEPGQTSGIIRSASGFHIIRLLEVEKVPVHVVRQTHARHILIRTNEVVGDSEARQRLQQIRARFLAGEDFADLARAYSQDTASATEGGDLGWLNPGDTVPAFDSVLQRLQPGEVSEPFRSRFGWHLVQVLERRDHDATETVKRARIIKALRARKQQEALALWMRRLRDEAYVEIRLES